MVGPLLFALVLMSMPHMPMSNSAWREIVVMQSMWLIGHTCRPVRLMILGGGGLLDDDCWLAPARVRALDSNGARAGRDCECVRDRLADGAVRVAVADISIMGSGTRVPALLSNGITFKSNLIKWLILPGLWNQDGSGSLRLFVGLGPCASLPSVALDPGSCALA